MKFAKLGWVLRSDNSTLKPSISEPELIFSDFVDNYSCSRSGDQDQRLYHLRFSDKIEVSLDFTARSILFNSARLQSDDLLLSRTVRNQIIPRICAHQGELVLHAGAIVHAGRVILLCGQSGRGKSTLTAAFANAGYTILGDDTVLISDRNGTPYGEAIATAIDLFPDSEAAIFGLEKSSQSARDKPQSKLSIAPHLLKMPPKAEYEIAGIGVLGTPAEHLGYERLGRVDGFRELLANSFMLDPKDRRESEARLAALSTLRGNVPVFRLDYPRRFDLLPRVIDLIEQMALDREHSA
jgi:hypothetical protein